MMNLINNMDLLLRRCYGDDSKEYLRVRGEIVDFFNQTVLCVQMFVPPSAMMWAP